MQQVSSPAFTVIKMEGVRRKVRVKEGESTEEQKSHTHTGYTVKCFVLSDNKIKYNIGFTVFHNCLNTFPDRLPHFIKPLNTNLKTHTQNAKSYTSLAKAHFALKTVLTLH